MASLRHLSLSAGSFTLGKANSHFVRTLKPHMTKNQEFLLTASEAQRLSEPSALSEPSDDCSPGQIS